MENEIDSVPETGLSFGAVDFLSAPASSATPGTVSKGHLYEIFVVPEMGPASSGYNLQQLPDSWSEAIKLRGLLEKAWRKALGSAARRKHQQAAKLQRRGQFASSVRTVSI